MALVARVALGASRRWLRRKRAVDRRVTSHDEVDCAAALEARRRTRRADVDRMLQVTVDQ